MSIPTVTVVSVKTRDKPPGKYVPGTIYSWMDTNGRLHISRTRGYKERDERNNKTRVYVHPESWAVLTAFEERGTEPVALLRQALAPAFAQLSIGPYKARWSRKAGCSCGCSPAFIIDARLGYDVFVTARYEAPEPTPEQAERRRSRRAALLSDPTIVAALAK